MSLAAFYALAFLRRWQSRVLLFAAAVALTVLSNWVRIYSIIVAGHLTDMQHYLVATEHISFGWLVFAVFLVPLVWLASRLEPPTRSPAAKFAPRVSAAPVVSAALLAALLLVLPPLGAALGTSAAESAATNVTLPPLIGEQRSAAFAWQPRFVNAVEQRRIDDSALPVVDVYRAIYPWQDAQHRLIRYANAFVGPEWQGVAERRHTVTLGGTELEVLELDGYARGRRRIIWGWYRVAGEPAAGPVAAKLLELRGLLAGRRDAVAVAISAECDIDCGAAQRRLAGFARAAAEDLIWKL
jgi:EpsI family protein